MDFHLLFDLLNLFKQQETAVYIGNWLAEKNIPFLKDKEGNIYNISRQAPLLSAHMDTVARDIHTFNSCGLTESIYKEVVVKKGEDPRKNIKVIKAETPRIIGADDKVGCFLIMSLLEENPNLNFLFSTNEEIGAVGAYSFVSNNDLSHIPYALVLDRAGDRDIICYDNRYGTKEFQDALCVVGQEFGYSPNTGIFSDCNVLNAQLSCANLSVGYYYAHTPSECIIIQDVEKAFEFAKKITEGIKEKFAPPNKLLHDFYYETIFEEAFVNKCPITNETENLEYIPRLKCFLSKKVIEAIKKDFLKGA